jgi:hypothetical protein
MKRFIVVALVTLLLSSFALAQTHAVTSVDGTTWEGTVRAPDSKGETHNNAYEIYFRGGNKLHWKWNDTVYTNGIWQQTGRAIRMELNDGYSTWLGTIEGNRITGNSVNKLGHKWDWVLTRKGPPATQASSGTQTPAGWINYSSKTGGFNILMPVQPQVQEKQVDTAAGKLTNHIFLAIKGQAAFALSYADYPANSADPQEVLNSVREGAINGIKGTLISSKDITHKGYPGREFKATTQGGVYSSRIYLVNTRLYQMVVVVPVAEAGASTADINRFLTSFDLKLHDH